MDWTVILDGLVLLMQVAFGMFLVWGLWLAMASHPRDEAVRPSESIARVDPASTEVLQ